MYWLWNKFTIMNHKGGGDLPKCDTFHFIASDVLRYDYNIKWVYLAHLKIITSCMIQAKTWKTLTVRFDWHQMISFRLAHLDGSIRISTGWAHKVFLYETTEVLGTARADLWWGVFFLTKNFFDTAWTLTPVHQWMTLSCLILLPTRLSSSNTRKSHEATFHTGAHGCLSWTPRCLSFSRESYTFQRWETRDGCAFVKMMWKFFRKP